jgi:hypothetical protein
MKVLLFNPLSGIQIRGISQAADELAIDLKKNNLSVKQINIPKCLYFNYSPVDVMVLIFFQQFVTFFYAVLYRPNVIIDPYNGYSLLASLFFKTKYFIHDFTAFKRKFWFLRPGTIYQYFLFKIDSKLNLARCYHDAHGIEHSFFNWKYEKKVMPCLINLPPIDDTMDYKINFKKNILSLVTISGPGWNKNFDELLKMLSSYQRPLELLAFGFGDEIGADIQNVKSTQSITKIGKVDYSEIVNTHLDSDFAIFYSLHEGYGRPIIEGLLLKKIIVTTKVPCLSILSKEALENVLTYECERTFHIAMDIAQNKKFQMYKKLYKENIISNSRELVLDD